MWSICLAIVRAAFAAGETHASLLAQAREHQTPSKGEPGSALDSQSHLLASSQDPYRRHHVLSHSADQFVDKSLHPVTLIFRNPKFESSYRKEATVDTLLRYDQCYRAGLISAAVRSFFLCFTDAFASQLLLIATSVAYCTGVRLCIKNTQLLNTCLVHLLPAGFVLYCLYSLGLGSELHWPSVGYLTFARVVYAAIVRQWIRVLVSWLVSETGFLVALVIQAHRRSVTLSGDAGVVTMPIELLTVSILSCTLCTIVAYMLELETRTNFLLRLRMRQSERQWRRVLDACPDGVLIRTQRGISYVNGAALHVVRQEDQPADTHTHADTHLEHTHTSCGGVANSSMGDWEPAAAPATASTTSSIAGVGAVGSPPPPFLGLHKRNRRNSSAKSTSLLLTEQDGIKLGSFSGIPMIARQKQDVKVAMARLHCFDKFSNQLLSGQQTLLTPVEALIPQDDPSDPDTLSAHAESPLLGASGLNRVVEVNGCRLNWWGEPASLLLLRDITERVQRDRATQADRVKTVLLATVSHEFRTPLNGILGMLQLLMDLDTSEEAQKYLKYALISGKLLLNLINDILDFSKIEADKFDLSWKPFDVRNCLREVTSVFVFQAQEKSIALEVSIHDSVPALIIGDCRRVQQVLLNLLSNALKWTSQGSIRCVLQVAKHRPDSKIELLFEVQDEGQGVKESEIDSLFSLFSQLAEHAAVQPGEAVGTGLGLYICKQLCRRMGGNIGCRSVYGKGATFWFTIVVSTYTPTLSSPIHAASPLESGSTGSTVPSSADGTKTARKVFPPRMVKQGSMTRVSSPLSHSTVRDHPTESDIDSPASPLQHPPGSPVVDNHPSKFIVNRLTGSDVDRLDLLSASMSSFSAPLVALQKQLQQNHLMQNGHSNGHVSSKHSVGTPLTKASQTPLPSPRPLHLSPKPTFADGVLRSLTPSPLVSPADSPHLSPRERLSSQVSPAAIGGGGSSSTAHYRRVLLVEDNDFNAMVASTMLAKDGFHVTRALHGVDALRKVQDLAHGGFHAVLMDCHMPEMDGYQATRLTREWEVRERRPRMPIIGLTAFASHENRQACLDAGMDDYLAKPVSRKKLLEVLQSWIQLRKTSVG
eukprot:GILJ01005485.1.p1 GENE.GILJ01005485.1~~GILJ01005485.1.p1  ORF type:complete len:1102 (+),score=146.36 GILJ01005485.1:113-3418(+)